MAEWSFPARRVSRRNFIKIVAVSGLAMGLGGALTRRLMAAGTLAVVEETRGAVGTYIRLVLLTPDRAGAERAIDAAFDRIAQLDVVLSHYRPDSALSQLNAAGQLPRPPAELVEVLRLAQQVHAWTGGAFDPTIEPLERFIVAQTAQGRRPSPADVRPLLPLVGLAQVAVAPEAIVFQRAGMALTLDGIGKGYIVEAALAALAEHGFPQAMVDAGGDISTSGRSDGAAWRLGIQDPRSAAGASIAVTKLARGALATSGDYLHAFTPDFSLNHILDPRTGLSPLELSSVSVMAARASLADALATGVMVLGREAGLRVVAGLPGVACLLVTKSGEVVRSAGFPA
jgi:thiamine biosynthesis lipoprotein